MKTQVYLFLLLDTLKFKVTQIFFVDILEEEKSTM